MNLSYDGLWKMLFNLNVTKMEFAKNIGISNATLAKLGKDEPVSLTVLMKICEHYNCKIENIIEFIPEKKEEFPNISTLNIGTILICSVDPIGTSVRNHNMQKRKYKNFLKKQPCVILQTKFRNGYLPQLLVAPLTYEFVADTILSVEFKNLELENNMIQHGYIQVGKMGYVLQQDCENILGRMPNDYMLKALDLLEKLKTVIGIDE